MKLFFLKDHSLYKIFKTLEKIPNNKTIHIYIDPEHAFFENERWGKQIQEILKEKNLNAYFITKTDKAKQFFEKIWLQVLHQEKHKIRKIANLIYLFFFNIKKFHLQVYTKKNYIFYIVSWFEIAFLLFIFYLLYTLILPSVTITLKSTNQIENVIYNFRYYPSSDTEYPKSSRYISIPFLTGYIDYKYEMSLSVKNIHHLQNPSQGQIKITNKTETPYSFIKGTRLETADGLVFKSNNWFKVPAAVWKNYGEIDISVSAAEQDNEWFLMGARGNIPQWTKLVIKNLKNSFYLKEIYGEALSQFSGGTLQSQWSITAKDIDILSGKLLEYIYKQKKNIISQNFIGEGKNQLLNFEKLIKTNNIHIKIDNKPGEKVPMIKWSIIVSLNFMYVQTKDVLDSVRKYLSQRPSEKVKLINIDKDSIIFFSDIKEDAGVYIIPTQTSVIQWYDFNKDINGVIESLKTRLIGMGKDEARDIILSYPEISSAKLKIRPPRYNTIPKLKSRMKFVIEGQGDE